MVEVGVVATAVVEASIVVVVAAAAAVVVDVDEGAVLAM